MEISNPDREYFPGVTKGRVVAHYEAVAGVMLPHLGRRPLTLERYPSGIAENGFMQKNASKHFPAFIERVEVVGSSTTTVHPAITDSEGLLYLANQGTITFHIPPVRSDDLTHPDRLVVDLDPAGDDPGRVAEAALATRDVLARYDVAATPMITGSSGLHVVVALERTIDVDEAGLLSRAIAGLVASTVPDVATTEFLKKDRGGRVFVDWLRNRYGQTVVAPWSLRPLPDATVAVPVAWDEVGSIHPAGVTIHRVAERLDREIVWAPAADLAPISTAIVDDARATGVDLDTPFDRFGRR